jgi:hypothetical protein
MWLLRKPANLALRDYCIAASPRLRRRGLRLKELMLVVLVVSLDAAMTMALFQRSSALLLISADLAMFAIVLAIGLFVTLSPTQWASVIVLLACAALAMIWRLLVAATI